MSASIKKKVSQNRTKLQQTTTTNNNKRPFFLPKINKVFLRPILQNLKGRSVLDKFFFENDLLDEPNQMPPSKFYLVSKLVKNAKWWSKSNLPLSHSTAKFFPLKKGFKKLYHARFGNCSTPKVPCKISSAHHANQRFFLCIWVTVMRARMTKGTQILQIYQIYKDAINLTSRWKVRFRQTFFSNWSSKSAL